MNINTLEIEPQVENHLKNIGVKEYADIYIYEDTLIITFTKYIEKYVDYKKYIFLEKHYDGNIMVIDSDFMSESIVEAFENFKIKHSLNLLKHNDKKIEVGVGDKNFLLVNTNFIFDINNLKIEDILKLIK